MKTSNLFDIFVVDNALTYELMKGVQMVKVTRVWTGEDWSPQHIDLSIIQLGPVNTKTTGPTVTAKLTGPWSAADKTHVGPLNLLYRRIADVCFELHFRVTPGQFRSAAVG